MKAKQFIIIVSIISLIVPNLTFASWWNPFTWRVFQRQTVEKSEEITLSPVSTSSVIVEIEQSKIDKQTTEIEQLKKELQELKKRTDPVVSLPILPTTPPVSTSIIQPTTSETWEELEIRFFKEANDDKDWGNTLVIENDFGEERYYRKENGQWIRKNTAEEMEKPYYSNTSTINGPTSEQLKRLTIACSLPGMRITCADKNFYKAFYSDVSFRDAMDEVFVKIQDTLEENQQNLYDQKKAQYECLMELTPVELRTLSPQQQRSMRESKCGTATPSSELNYKLYQQQQYQDCVTKNPINYDTTCGYLKPTFY